MTFPTETHVARVGSIVISLIIAKCAMLRPFVHLKIYCCREKDMRKYLLVNISLMIKALTQETVISTTILLYNYLLQGNQFSK